jgi:hypothetical protein
MMYGNKVGRQLVNRPAGTGLQLWTFRLCLFPWPANGSLLHDAVAKDRGRQIRATNLGLELSG